MLAKRNLMKYCRGQSMSLTYRVHGNFHSRTKLAPGLPTRTLNCLGCYCSLFLELFLLVCHLQFFFFKVECCIWREEICGGVLVWFWRGRGEIGWFVCFLSSWESDAHSIAALWCQAWMLGGSTSPTHRPSPAVPLSPRASLQCLPAAGVEVRE